MLRNQLGWTRPPSSISINWQKNWDQIQISGNIWMYCQTISVRHRGSYMMHLIKSLMISKMLNKAYAAYKVSTLWPCSRLWTNLLGARLSRVWGRHQYLSRKIWSRKLQVKSSRCMHLHHLNCVRPKYHQVRHWQMANISKNFNWKNKKQRKDWMNCLRNFKFQIKKLYKWSCRTYSNYNWKLLMNETRVKKVQMLSSQIMVKRHNQPLVTNRQAQTQRTWCVYLKDWITLSNQILYPKSTLA